MKGERHLTDANAIIERLGALFVKSFHIEVPSPDADLLDLGILNSLQFVELLLQLEQQFGLRIKIEDIDLNDLRTLAQIARLVAANGGAAGPVAARPSSEAAA
jgi:acyl carrier protein